MGRLKDGGSPERKWIGVYAFPREWTLEDEVLFQRPAPELKILRCEHMQYRGTINDETRFIGNATTEFELVVEMDLGTAQACGVEIRRSNDGSQGYRITWDGEKAYAQSISPEPNSAGKFWWMNPIPIFLEKNPIQTESNSIFLSTAVWWSYLSMTRRLLIGRLSIFRLNATESLFLQAMVKPKY